MFDNPARIVPAYYGSLQDKLVEWHQQAALGVGYHFVPFLGAIVYLIAGQKK